MTGSENPIGPPPELRGPSAAEDAWEPRGRLARGTARVPRWVIALVLVSLLSGMEYLSVQYESLLDDPAESDIFGGTVIIVLICLALIAGAIQRMNWRHGLVILPILGAGWGLEELLVWSGIINIGGYHPHLWLIYPSVLMLAMGIGEMLTTSLRSPRAFLWVFVAVVAAVAVHSTIHTFIKWMDVVFTIPTSSSGRFHVRLSGMTYWPIFCLAAWIFLPLGLSAARRTARSVRIAVVAFLAAGVLHTVFFYSIAFSLAGRSLAGDGLFSRQIGVELLEIQGDDSHFDTVLQALLEADWEHFGTDHSGNDWREKAIAVVSAHDRAPKAAGALADLLRKKPSGLLAGYVGDLMVAHKRYEILHVYFRYSLIPEEYGPRAYNRILVRFGLPQAGLRLLIAGRVEKFGPGAYSGASDFDIDPEIREVLKSLLKKDVGARYSAWADAVVQAISNSPSILPEYVQNELDRELACYVKRSSAAIRLQNAFRTAVEVSPPDYDAPTIEAFEHEIDAYVDRVNAVIKKHKSPIPTPSVGAGQ